MTLNPFTLLEKAINEHGSATIILQRLELARDEYAVLQRKLTDAESSLVEATETISQLQSENERLKADLQNAQMEIRNLQEEFYEQRTESHEQPLGEQKDQIISLLAQESKTTEELAGLLGVGEQAIFFHLEDERMQRFTVARQYPLVISVQLTSAGRRYAVERGLLSAE